mmetsp:Transcript_1443/g.4079  ORF Transcript_1443/g.4079 Transcript_1443/m.4079 type:complete len:206 (-) Transcript_1443:293-910(-)
MPPFAIIKGRAPAQMPHLVEPSFFDLSRSSGWGGRKDPITKAPAASYSRRVPSLSALWSAACAEHTYLSIFCSAAARSAVVVAGGTLGRTGGCSVSGMAPAPGGSSTLRLARVVMVGGRSTSGSLSIAVLMRCSSGVPSPSANAEARAMNVPSVLDGKSRRLPVSDGPAKKAWSSASSWAAVLSAARCTAPTVAPFDVTTLMVIS